MSKNDKKAERRKWQRHKCYGEIFFATGSRFYEGQCKDYSRSGLFIQTTEIFSLGDVVSVALPFSNQEDDKRKAQIIWQNMEGFGAEFLIDQMEPPAK